MNPITPASSPPEKIYTRQDRVRTWTRTDTARWLNERSAGLLAYLRRVVPDHAPAHSGSMGRWLQEKHPTLFTRAHARLAAAKNETAREKLNLIGVIA